MKKQRWIGIAVFVVACGGAKPTPDEPRGGAQPTGNGIVMETVTIEGGYEMALGEGRYPKGPLDKESIQTAITIGLHELQACYNARLAESPGLAGTTTVVFTVGPDGAVTAGAASGFDPAVDACVATEIQSRSFGQPAGGNPVEVTQPFDFRPAPPRAEEEDID